jgi:maleylacetate reductase
MNALAHGIEAAYAPDASPVTRLLSAESVAALTTALPRIVRDPDDLGVRRRAQYGASLAGSVLGATTMGLHHKLAHILGGTYSLPHAGTHSALLPQVAAFDVSAAPGPLASVARALGGLDAGGIGPAFFDLARAIGAPTSLSQLGLSAAVVVDVVRQVMDAGIINPRPLEDDAVAEVLRDAVDGHRPGDFAGAEPGRR